MQQPIIYTLSDAKKVMTIFQFQFEIKYVFQLNGEKRYELVVEFSHFYKVIVKAVSTVLIYFQSLIILYTLLPISSKLFPSDYV